MARISENSKGRIRTEFESVADVFRTIESQNWTPKRHKTSDDRGRSGSFHTFSSLDEAIDVYVNHPERIRQFNNNDIKLESIESPGKDVYHDVIGDFIDMGKFLDDDPECMGNATLGNPRSIFATINIMVAKVHYTRNDYINQLQRRVIRLVDWLENQNIRCQIVATSVTECANVSVIVKEYTDPIDLNDLAIVCHGDFLRRIIFLIKEQSKTWSGGYGSAIDYDKRMIKYAPEPEDGMYIYVGGYMPYDGDNDGIDELNKAFDVIETRIKRQVEDGLTWNEEPLAIAGNTMRERTWF